MNLKMPQLVALSAAMVLLYSAIKNVSPKAVLEAVLTGKPLPVADPLPSKTPVTDSNGNADGSINGKGEYVPRTDSNLPQPQAPNSDGTPNTTTPSGSVGVVYQRPYGNAVVTSV